MKNEPKKGSGVPLIIIVGVLVAVVVGGVLFYNSSSKSTPNRNSANANRNTAIDMSKIPAGAEPPNMLGSPTAAVVLEEFADFQCPSCGQVHPIMKQIQSMYGSRIKFIFREFPLQMHDKAYDAANAAEAAGMQGSDKFWAMQNLLYTNQKTWSVDPNYKQVFADYAKQIGLNMDKFESDRAGISTKSRVDADLNRGRALQVNSTPSLYINNKPVPFNQMNVEGIRQLIDSELQTAGAKPATPAGSTNAPAANSAPATNSAAPAANSK
jgi:protein-disulfide isomerase